jgi:hypothetical protein
MDAQLPPAHQAWGAPPNDMPAAGSPSALVPSGFLAEQIRERASEVAGRQAVRYKIGSTSVTFAERLAYAGKILERNCGDLPVRLVDALVVDARRPSSAPSRTRASFAHGRAHGAPPAACRPRRAPRQTPPRTARSRRPTPSRSSGERPHARSSSVTVISLRPSLRRGS